MRCRPFLYDAPLTPSREGSRAVEQDCPGQGLSDRDRRPTAIAISAELSPSLLLPFDLMLWYLRDSPASAPEDVDDVRYRCAVLLHGPPALVDITSLGTVEAPRLHVTVHGKGLAEAGRAAAVALVRRLYDLDTDLSDFSVVAAQDPVFVALARQCRGIRLVLIPDPFEALVWAITARQIRLALAGKLKKTLVAHSENSNVRRAALSVLSYAGAARGR